MGLVDRLQSEGTGAPSAAGPSLFAFDTRQLMASIGTSGPLRPWCGETELFIYPPYTFRCVDALVTNFHLPRSTLLLLVAAFAGVELTRQAYQTAVAQQYRFFSYGDAMLIL